MASTMRLDPDAVAGATFSPARRGYDPDEVRPFLRAVSDELERLRQELDEARAQLAHRTSPVVDDASVAAALGEEAVRVLTTAREGAAQIRARAEESAAELIRDANEDATRLRREADLDVTHRRQLATAEAEAAVEAAKSEGREMVAEARAVRERMLDDLSRRRERARAQFEQLRQSYERVLRTFESSGGTLAAITEDLRAIGPEVGANATTLESTGDTGPVAIIEPPVERVAEPPAAPPVVQVVVPQRVEPAHDDPPAAPAVVEADAGVDVDAVLEAAEATDAEAVAVVEPEPDVVVQALVLGELDPSMLTAGRDHDHDPDPDPPSDVLVIVETVTVETLEIDTVQVDPPTDDGVEPDDDVEMPVAVEAVAPNDAVDESAVATDLDDTDASTPHKPLPSTEDLFARIRAAREQLKVDVHEVIVTTTPAVAAERVELVEPVEPVEPAVAESRPVVAPQVATGPVVTAADAVAARSSALGPIEEAIARRLKRVLADEQNDVLDRLRRAKTSPTVDELVGDVARHAAAYQQAVEGDAWAAAVAGARSLAADPEAVDETIVGRGELAAAIAAEVATELVEPFRAKLADTLATHEPADAAELLRAVYRDWKTQRVDAVSEQVACFAYGRGAFAALMPGTPVCWAVDPDGPGCPEGEDNTLGGAVPAGDAFPTGHTCTPAYVGCRCILLPTTAP